LLELGEIAKEHQQLEEVKGDLLSRLMLTRKKEKEMK
jgi:hypothetical protein